MLHKFGLVCVHVFQAMPGNKQYLNFILHLPVCKISYVELNKLTEIELIIVLFQTILQQIMILLNEQKTNIQIKL